MVYVYVQTIFDVEIDTIETPMFYALLFEFKFELWCKIKYTLIE